VIPEVRYGPWQGDRWRGPAARVRALHCSRCDAILARQTSAEEKPLDSDPSTLLPLRPFQTYCRPELILLRGLASVSSPGLPVYGLAGRQRRGKSPRRIARHQQSLRISGGIIPFEMWGDFFAGGYAAIAGKVDSHTEIRSVRRRVRLEPGVRDRLPGEARVYLDRLPGEAAVYLPNIVSVPCELFCINCHDRHLLTGGGQEEWPPVSRTSQGCVIKPERLH